MSAEYRRALSGIRARRFWPVAGRFGAPQTLPGGCQGVSDASRLATSAVGAPQAPALDQTLQGAARTHLEFPGEVYRENLPSRAALRGARSQNALDRPTRESRGRSELWESTGSRHLEALSLRGR